MELVCAAIFVNTGKHASAIKRYETVKLEWEGAGQEVRFVGIILLHA